jgi:hypothetical protein
MTRFDHDPAERPSHPAAGEWDWLRAHYDDHAALPLVRLLLLPRAGASPEQQAQELEAFLLSEPAAPAAPAPSPPDACLFLTGPAAIAAASTVP